MGGVQGELLAHLQTGLTTVCRAWALTRRDGTVLGFTDHDKTLSFEGIDFKPDSGMTTATLQQSTGLSVDNTETMGALSDAAITEADIEAGRYDGAEVRTWMLNWADVNARHMVFRGSLGELRRGDGAFHAELRGLTEALNRPLGRVYQKPCTAVLGDGGCKFDTSEAGYFEERALEVVEEGRVFRFDDMTGFDDGWFTFGTLEALSGACAGLKGVIKRDYFEEDQRVIELWHPMRASIVAGDQIRLTAGCDKRMSTCRIKFHNLLNFQGFPDVPGDSWLAVQPVQAGQTSGGSRR
ncbi:DUF2163 domain-containing protein [Lentibacter algarum]|uniref:DUF2163 domain-containing protein n=1 Tax=Lentibacter algarum TaxID=576131 RepID=UPI001C0929FC|nr:DUF2163 domain-containing protein [Lentibacter algarum]MBU2982729.1 DUF2163 domain-containing protein [Lentibacter algarum]